MNHYPPRIGPPAGAPSQRLNELLDQIRAEFDTESNRSVDYEGQSESPGISHHPASCNALPAESTRSPVLRRRGPAQTAKCHLGRCKSDGSHRCPHKVHMS